MVQKSMAFLKTEKKKGDSHFRSRPLELLEKVRVDWLNLCGFQEIPKGSLIDTVVRLVIQTDPMNSRLAQGFKNLTGEFSVKCNPAFAVVVYLCDGHDYQYGNYGSEVNGFFQKSVNLFHPHSILHKKSVCSQIWNG